MPTLEADVMADLQSADAKRRLLAVQSFTLSETVFSVDVFDRLGQLARDDPSDEVRAAAAQALRTTRGRMKVAQVDAGAGTMPLEMISSILASAETTERQRLLSGLQQRDDPAVLPAVLEALTWETDDRVIAKILSLVGRHGTAEHVPLVRRFLGHADAKVQATALDAVGVLAAVAPPPELLDHLAVIAATHVQPDVRFLARRVVGVLRPKPQEEALPADPIQALAALAQAADPRQIARLIMVVKEHGTSAQAEALKPFLKHEDPRVCANAVEALVALADEDVLPSLFPLLAREDNRLRANLMLAIYPRYPEQVMGYVRRMLRSEKQSFRVSGLYCAQFLDHGEMYPTVLELLQSEREPGCFAALLEWAAKHGPADKVARDLPDLAALRVDRAADVEATLARLRGETPAVRPPAPLDPPQPAPPRNSGPIAVPRVTGSTPVARTTGPIPVGGRRPTGRVPVSSRAERAEPPARPRWRRILGHPATLVAVAMTGLSLVAVLAFLKPPPPAGPAPGQLARTLEPDRKPHRAMVLRAQPGPDGSLEIVLFGSPFKLRTEALKGRKLERGATLWLVEPKVARDKDGTGYLTAQQVAVGDQPTGAQ